MFIERDVLLPMYQYRNLNNGNLDSSVLLFEDDNKCDAVTREVGYIFKVVTLSCSNPTNEQETKESSGFRSH